MGWGVPVGVTGFYAGWDEHCDRLRSERSMVDDDDNNAEANRRRDRDDSIGNNLMIRLLINIMIYIFVIT